MIKSKSYVRVSALILASLLFLNLAACDAQTGQLDTHSPQPYPSPEITTAIDLSPYYGKPAPAVLIIEGQSQIAGIGTYSWVQSKKGDQTEQMVADAFALITPADPLGVSSSITNTLTSPYPIEPSKSTYPITATLVLPYPIMPSIVAYVVQPVTENKRARPPEGDKAAWVTSAGSDIFLQRETTQNFTLILEQGSSVMNLRVEWEGLGSVNYGFYIEVQ